MNVFLSAASLDRLIAVLM